MPVNEFNIEYDLLVNVLISIVVFSFLIERALSIIFENRMFIEWVEGRPSVPPVLDANGKTIQKAQKAFTRKKGVREIIAIAVSGIFCYWQGFDAITILLKSGDQPHPGGLFITALIIAGGSKASMGLFKDLLGFMSSAEKARKEANQTN